MRLLADTHVFLWWLANDPRLNSTARDALSDADSQVFISAATIWEIAIKVKLDKLEFEGDPVAEITASGFTELPMTAQHCQRAGSLPRHHDDPFDRMLIAQAELEQLILVSVDGAFSPYGIQILHA